MIGNRSNDFCDEIIPFLTDALYHARKCLKLKAANKVYPDKDRLRKIKQNKPESFMRHSKEADKWRWEILNTLRTLDSGEDKIASIKAIEASIRTGQEYAGNCSEYAILAYRYIISNKSSIEKKLNTSIRIIYSVIPSPGDHAFVIVSTKQKNIPNSFFLKDLDNDSVICDPWANIICVASEFSNMWRQKMMKWTSRGLHIEIDRGPIEAIRFSNIFDLQRVEIYSEF